MRFALFVCACTFTCLAQQREWEESVIAASRAAETGHYTAAAQKLAAALNAARAFDAGAHRLAWTLNELGLMELQLGQLRAAGGHLYGASKMCETDGIDDTFCATVLHNIATLHIRLHEYEKAKKFANRAIEMGAAGVAPNDAGLAKNVTMLATLELQSGRYLEAERLQRNALALWAKHESAHRQEVVLGLNNLSGILYSQQRYSEAQALLEEALTMATKSLGAEHQLTVGCQWNLGTLHMNLQRYADAEPLLARCLALLRLSPENRDKDVAMVADQYATVLRKLRRGREAKQYERLVQAVKARDPSAYTIDHVVDVQTLTRSATTRARGLASLCGLVSRSRAGSSSESLPATRVYRHLPTIFRPSAIRI